MNNIFDTAHQHLQQHLSPSRYQHSVGVMHIIADLAEIYTLDQEQAELTGLVHDIAKDLSAAELLTFAKQGALPITYTLERHPMYLHGPVGAYLAQQTLLINDTQILTAIRTHTTHASEAGANHRLCWCLRFADILAPVIPWPGQEKFHQTVYAGQFSQAQLLISTWIMKYFEQAAIPIHPNFKHHTTTLAAELHVTPEFYARE